MHHKSNILSAVRSVLTHDLQGHRFEFHFVFWRKAEKEPEGHADEERHGVVKEGTRKRDKLLGCLADFDRVADGVDAAFSQLESEASHHEEDAIEHEVVREHFEARHH